MFTKPASGIEFDDIEAFCQEWGEGVRVEYKREITRESLPKIISAFANTQGGILIIGVEADKKRNKVISQIQGIPHKNGIEEQIVQIAITRIHPAVTPEVIIREVPGETDRVVVVVRVEESEQAPHAIQNTNRVYIRVASITQPNDGYEDASIDKIEYLLKRHEEPQRISRRILERIEERVRDYSSHLEEPNLELIARPVFPYRPMIPPTEIYKFMDVHTLVPFSNSDSNFGRRNVTGGVCYMDDTDGLTYSEMNEYGVIYNRGTLNREPWRKRGKLGNEPRGTEKFIVADDIALRVFKFLWLSKDFYHKCEYFGNIKVTIRMREIDKETLKFQTDRNPNVLEARKSVESEVAASDQCLPHDLTNVEACTRIFIGLLGQLFWVFNVREKEGEWWDGWHEYVAKVVGR